MDAKKLKLLSEINTTETNYKAEVIAAGLMDAGGEKEEALIVRNGGHSKDVAKDISKIGAEFSGLDLIEYLYIHTNRYDIYDSQPEACRNFSLMASVMSVILDCPVKTPLDLDVSDMGSLGDMVDREKTGRASGTVYIEGISKTAHPRIGRLLKNKIQQILLANTR